MFTCMKPHTPPHQHSTVLEAKRCWAPLIADFRSLMIPPVPEDDHRDRPGTITRRQSSYLIDVLGVPPRMLRRDDGMLLSMRQASLLIDNVKSGAVNVNDIFQAERVEDRRITMLKGMLGAIPDGHYAVRKDDTVNYTFIRIKQTKTGRYKGSRTISTQHSDDYVVRIAIRPSGNWSVYSGGDRLLDDLLILVTDNVTAAHQYSRIIKRCTRCNKQLTDDRSRHYGIGPECETYRPDIIEFVDNLNGGPYHR